MASRPVTRKDFLLTAGKGICGLAMAAGVTSWLAGCAVARQSVYKAQLQEKKIAVPLTLFAEKNMQVVAAPGWEYNLLVVKEKDQSYKALLMKCTHQGFRLTADKNGMHCNLHGSTFDLEGDVTNGPAAKPLASFPVALEKDFLLIG
jgi:Rieske Fe-S protein